MAESDHTLPYYALKSTSYWFSDVRPDALEGLKEAFSFRISK